jgi:NADH-quinone oxidoreductase subunit A
MSPNAANAVFEPWSAGVFSLSVYAVIVFVLIALLFFVSSYIGEKKTNPDKLRPYESGIIPTGTARLKFPVPFFMVAIFFLIFDVEGAFIFSWAVAAEQTGWTGWFQMTYFIFVLLIGLVYIWRKRGLDWGPDSAKK